MSERLKRNIMEKTIKKKREIHSLDMAVVLFFDQLRLIAAELSDNQQAFCHKFPIDILKIKVIEHYPDKQMAILEIRHSLWNNKENYVYLCMTKSGGRWEPTLGKLYAPTDFLDDALYYALNFFCFNVVNGGTIIIPETNSDDAQKKKLARKNFLKSQYNIKTKDIWFLSESMGK